MDAESGRKTKASKTDRVGMMNPDSSKAINRLIRCQDLCEELLETLTITLTFIKDYTEEHNIPIPNREKLAYLLQKTILLLEECGLSQTNLQKSLKSRKLPNHFFDDRDPEELPEPRTVKDISFGFHGTISEDQ